MKADNFSRIIEHTNEHLGEKYLEVKHKSGLDAFIFPKDRQSSCAILACEYGSIDNEYAENGKAIKIPDGVAHFLEHKMFENPDGTSVEEFFSKMGADTNAFTKWDATAYYFTCGSNEKFYPCLDKLINFVMTPGFTEESVKKEQGIIAQEIVMCEDDPYDRCFLNLIGALYSKNPIRIDVAGTVESISEIDEKLLRACHARFYTPANMKLIVCGDVATDRILEAIENGFPVEKYSASKKPKKILPIEPKDVNTPRVSVNMAVERPMFCLGFKDSNAPKDSREGRKREILAEILVGLLFSSSGELYNDLYKRGIMTTPFDFGEEYGKDHAFVYVGGECDDPELVLNEIERHLEKIKKKGIPEEDFTRRKRITYSSDIRLYDSTWDIASALLDDTLAGVELFDEAERINCLTLKDADQLLNELFCERSMAYSIVLPKNNEGN